MDGDFRVYEEEPDVEPPPSPNPQGGSSPPHDTSGGSGGNSFNLHYSDDSIEDDIVSNDDDDQEEQDHDNISGEDVHMQSNGNYHLTPNTSLSVFNLIFLNFSDDEPRPTPAPQPRSPSPQYGCPGAPEIVKLTNFPGRYW